MSNANRPVFPHIYTISFNENYQIHTVETSDSLTKREYFAAHAPEMPVDWLYPDAIALKEIGEPVPHPYGDEFDGMPAEKRKPLLDAYVAYQNKKKMYTLRHWRYYYADMMLAEEGGEQGRSA